MDDLKTEPENLDPEPAPESAGTTRPFKSKYEFVMAAAKEAERLNDHLRKTGIATQEKVTIEAIRRIGKALSKVVYEEPPGGSEEPPKESTYFFGS